jgi:hypothetical protein
MISGRLTIVDDPLDIAASRFPMADTKYQRSNAANDSHEHDDRDNDGRIQAGAYTKPAYGIYASCSDSFPYFLASGATSMPVLRGGVRMCERPCR